MDNDLRTVQTVKTSLSHATKEKRLEDSSVKTSSSHAAMKNRLQDCADSQNIFNLMQPCRIRTDWRTAVKTSSPNATMENTLENCADSQKIFISCNHGEQT